MAPTSEDHPDRDILFKQMRQRGRTIEDQIRRISEGQTSVSTSSMPGLMIDWVRGWMAEAEKRLQEYEFAYQELLKILPVGEQPGALVEMNNI